MNPKTTQEISVSPPAPKVQAVSGVPASQTGFPRKILLMDSDPAFAASVRDAAREHNALVFCCRSFSDMADVIDVDLFDLVLLNSRNKRTERGSVASFLRLFFRQTPVIVMTEDPFELEQEGHDTLFGYVDRAQDAETILVRVSHLFARHYGLEEREDEENSDFDYSGAEYTHFCGTRAPSQMTPFVSAVMATIGKVILANASLVSGSRSSSKIDPQQPKQPPAADKQVNGAAPGKAPEKVEQTQVTARWKEGEARESRAPAADTAQEQTRERAVAA